MSSTDVTGTEATSTTGTVSTYGVTGMTCGHCVGSVTEELGRLDGVAAVDVELVKGGVSRVTVRSTAALDADSVASAVDEAGYELADLSS